MLAVLLLLARNTPSLVEDIQRRQVLCHLCAPLAKGER